ncbi:TPA: hypothetical protein R5W31_000830 [Campylobacter jejuni]|nr:hypothetical protein [Campylobacter jejuni]
MRENILIKKLYVDNDIIRDLYKKSLDFAINEREKAIDLEKKPLIFCIKKQVKEHIIYYQK